MRRAGLISRREAAIWAGCFLLVSVLLVLTRFTSDDPDSALYAALSARLADGPPSHWIAPEWWGHWESEGLFREHPVGVMLLPTLLGALHVPGVQAAYIVGIAAGVAALLLIGWLVSQLTSVEDGRWVLVLLQIMPAASIFRIRANHEYPMLVCLLLVLIGLDRVRVSWVWTALVAFALSFALLVKGVFVAIPLLAAGLWILINPTRRGGSPLRPIAAVLVGLAAMGLVAAGYETWYHHVTGDAFWGPYWERQLAPLTLATPAEGGGPALAGHLPFYILRLLWHPAPWSLGLIAIAWQRRGDGGAWWRGASERARRGTVFAISFAVLATLLLSPASRFAERYVFSATFAIGTLGAVAAVHAWPRLVRALVWLDARVPALPAATWLLLMLLRLTLGPFLPRI